jgi:alcohol dehydrogenase class IV
MASTGLGVCHAIGHSLGGRFDIAHGVALTMVLPGCSGSTSRLPGAPRRVAFALGAGTPRAVRRGTRPRRSTRSPRCRTGWDDAPAARLRDHRRGFRRIAADALDDEVLANTPRRPTEADIQAILAGALHGTRGTPATSSCP